MRLQQAVACGGVPALEVAMREDRFASFHGIVALALLSLCHAEELAQGSGLARGVCAYGAVFWGVRLTLQGVFDVREHLTTWWLRLGYYGLTVLFASFTAIYTWAALLHDLPTDSL